MREAAPDYFLNVPALLERMRKAVDEQLWKTGGIVRSDLHAAPKARGCASRKGKRELRDSIWLALGQCDGVSRPSARR